MQRRASKRNFAFFYLVYIIKYYLSYIGASTGYRIIMFQDLLFRYIRPGDGKNAACGLKIIFFGGGIFCRYEYLNFKCKIFNIL